MAEQENATRERNKEGNVETELGNVLGINGTTAEALKKQDKVIVEGRYAIIIKT